MKDTIANQKKQIEAERKEILRFTKKARTIATFDISDQEHYESIRFILACRAFVKSYDG